MVWRILLSTIIRYGFLLILIGFLTVTVIVMVRNNTSQQERITYFENAVLEQFAIQAELQLEAGHTIAASLAAAQEQITYLENVILRQSALQAELQQRTVHTITTSLAATEAVIIDRAGGSLFMQSALIEMEREAVAFFQSGKYAQARDLFFTVATAQPENFEARFFHLYSLFLNNRMDRSNYSRIREGFLALERNGFIREEIRAVLEFIEREELGYPMAEASL